MVRLAIVGAALAAVAMAAPAAPIELPSQISDAHPMFTGRPSGAPQFPEATRTGKFHHHTPTPSPHHHHHHTPTPGAHRPHATPLGGEHHKSGHLMDHILPRWLQPRAMPIESDGHRGEKHNPEFPGAKGGRHHHATPTPGAHHTPGAGHHGHHTPTGSFELPKPTGVPSGMPIIPIESGMPTGVRHPMPLESAGGPKMGGQ